MLFQERDFSRLQPRTASMSSLQTRPDFLLTDQKFEAVALATISLILTVFPRATRSYLYKIVARMAMKSIVMS